MILTDLIVVGCSTRLCILFPVYGSAIMWFVVGFLGLDHGSLGIYLRYDIYFHFQRCLRFNPGYILRGCIFLLTWLALSPRLLYCIYAVMEYGGGLFVSLGIGFATSALLAPLVFFTQILQMALLFTRVGWI